MYRVICVACLALLSLGSSETLSRQKRIVGGEPANPPPPGASEAEDVVENPALASVQPVRQPSNDISTTTKRPVSSFNDDDDDGPIVFLRRGRREARVKGRKEAEGVYAFQGLRYAEAPVGVRRFQRPRRLFLEGPVNATSTGPPCAQTYNQQVIGSEDCLFLNVYSPALPESLGYQKLPVIFWIHGGGFRRGSGSQYGAADMVKKGLVVVTIQYRLGSLGFLSTNRKELPGNAGLFDIAASLRWVRNYIQFFGGDHNHIIPSGQGSGASAAVMLTHAHFTKRWIKGVFAMSGSAISSFAVDKEPEETARAVSVVDDCYSVSESLAFVRCMQKLPLETVIRGDDKVQEHKLSQDNAAQSYITSISKLLNPGPAVEGEDDLRFLPNFLTDKPSETLRKGDFAKVPMLTGVTKDETSTSAKGGGLSTKLLSQVEATEELLQNMIPELLQIAPGVLGKNPLSPVVNQLLSNNNYLKGITSSLSRAASALDKIIEVTTDALFNLPAFLTSQLWSKQSNVYLYSFEHDSSASAADSFLQESPLTERVGNTHVEGVGHGDDLLYLFDARTLYGEPIEALKLKEPDDLQVRESFTSLVAEFARTGQPKIGGRSAEPFSEQNGNYIVINSSPSLEKGFRKCQMGLWAGLTDVLKSSECSFLQLGDLVNTLGLGGVTNVTRGVTDSLTKPVTNLNGGLRNTTSGLTSGLGGLLGNRGQAQPGRGGGLLGQNSGGVLGGLG